MNKKLLLFTLLAMLLWGGLFLSAEETQQKEEKIKLEKAYAYKEEQLLIGETDLYGSYLIRKNEIPETVKVFGVERGVDIKMQYGEGESVLIERGKLNLNVNDRVLIISQGSSVRNKYLPAGGFYYYFKAIARVEAVNKDEFKVNITTCFFPVSFGDLAIAFNPQETLVGKKISYLMSRLPEKSPTGRIALFPFEKKYKKEFSAMNEWAISSLTKKEVKRGDFLLIYRQLKDNLPPLIIGSAIVIHAEDIASTVKILESSLEIEPGDYVVYLPAAKLEKKETSGELPIVKTLETETEEGVKTSNFDILFNIDSAEISPAETEKLNEIATIVKESVNYNIILRGYACSIGQIEYNLALSQKRAENVKNYLTEKLGLDASRIESYFYGENESLNDNSAEETRRLNRVVKIEVLVK